MKLGLLLLCITFASTPSFAESGEQRRGRRGPPQEAIDACSSSSVGDNCSFEGRRQDTISGTCQQKDESKPLACRPSSRRK